MSVPKSSLRNMIFALGIFTILAGSLLGGVYVLTKEPIALAHDRAVSEAVASVTPEFDRVEAPVNINVEGLDRPLQLYAVSRAGVTVGAAVNSYSMDGFSGEITVMFGFDVNGVVTGYQVLTHQETPGLGAKMVDWFRTGTERTNIIGLDPTLKKAYVSKDGGDIDGITAATISSRAFLAALNAAHSACMSYFKSLPTSTK